MSTITLDAFHGDFADTTADSLSESFFAGMVRAREVRAADHVARVLRGRSDVALADLGFDAGEITAIRATGKIRELLEPPALSADPHSIPIQTVVKRQTPKVIP